MIVDEGDPLEFTRPGLLVAQGKSADMMHLHCLMLDVSEKLYPAKHVKV